MKRFVENHTWHAPTLLTLEGLWGRKDLSPEDVEYGERLIVDLERELHAAHQDARGVGQRVHWPPTVAGPLRRRPRAGWATPGRWARAACSRRAPRARTARAPLGARSVGSTSRTGGRRSRRSCRRCRRCGARDRADTASPLAASKHGQHGEAPAADVALPAELVVQDVARGRGGAARGVVRWLARAAPDESNVPGGSW